MKTTTRLAVAAVVSATATALVATLALVPPAHAQEPAGDAAAATGTVAPVSTPTATPDAEFSADAPETVRVRQLPDGDYEVTQLSTGEVFVIPGFTVAPTPTSEHHLVDGCGLDWGRPYCDLTRAAQGLLIAGSLAAVAAAICSATGWITCGIAAGVASAAAWYLIEYGRCSGNLRVRLNYNGTVSAWCL